MKILLSAYACEPHKGSEQAVGWEWARRLAEHVDVTCLTRANNRGVIEADLLEHPVCGNLEFVYVDLPRWVTALKKRGVIPVFLYYLLWQLHVRMLARGLMHSVDVVHHVTFNGFRYPGAWWCMNIPVVLGPLGGGSIAAPQYRRCFGKRWLQERVREFSVRLWHWNPWTRLSLACADRVLVVGDYLAREFGKRRIPTTPMLETAVPMALQEERLCLPVKEHSDFIWVGNIEPWKAWQIALEAFASATKKGSLGDARFRIIGRGSQQREAEAMVRHLGISDRVIFHGPLPREEVWSMMRKSRALVFSSIRDTSGNVVLEAMAQGIPVICFNHQGVGFMTDDFCAIRVEPETWESSVAGFADAIERLAGDDHQVTTMGRAARVRAMAEFSWDAKVKRVLEIYEEVARGRRGQS